MQEFCKPGWTVLTHDAIVTSDPALLCCVSLTVVDSGDYIAVYEGSDSSSGRKILTMEALANRSQAYNFTIPIYCERGISVTFSTDDSEATIVWIAADSQPEQTERD